MQYLCGIILLITSTTAFLNDILHLEVCLNKTQSDSRNVNEKWIVQPLDHFNSNERRTINIRYFENLQFWKPNSPIYIYIGGEVVPSPNVISNRDEILIVHIAKETQGALFATEHRYYGQSLPDLPKDNIIEYYQFLSSHQALEDLANLIKKLKSDPKFKSSKVVVIGGSYAGNLAVWIRELHPELVDAAVASSAPVFAKKDFHEYLDTVRYTFSKYGTENCLNKIEKDFNRTEELLKSVKGREELKKELNICKDNDLTVYENQQLLFDHFKYFELKFISQFGWPEDVYKWCMENKTLNMVNHNNTMLWRDNCYNVDFESYDWSKLPKTQWGYQSCTEFGYQQTTSSERQPFVHWAPLETSFKLCKYFVKGNVEEAMDQGIAMTNKRYGGLTPNVTKVVFTHGDMDPWHKLGVLEDLGPDAPVTMVNGTSHCGILCVQDTQSQELKDNQKYVTELIKKWISF